MRTLIVLLLCGGAAALEACPSLVPCVYYAWGGGEDFDEEDEDSGVLHEIEIRLPRTGALEDEDEEPLPPERERRKAFALRLGALITTAAKFDWKPALAGELAYEGRNWEAGVEVSQVRMTGGPVEARAFLLTARVGLLLKTSVGLRAFLSGGAVVELGEIVEPPDEQTYWGGVVTVGAGYSPAGGSWDLRACYNFLLGIENASGSVFAGAGVRF